MLQRLLRDPVIKTARVGATADGAGEGEREQALETAKKARMGDLVIPGTKKGKAKTGEPESVDQVGGVENGEGVHVDAPGTVAARAGGDDEFFTAVTGLDKGAKQSRGILLLDRAHL